MPEAEASAEAAGTGERQPLAAALAKVEAQKAALGRLMMEAEMRKEAAMAKAADVERLVAENERLKAENARLVAEAAEREAEAARREAEYLAAVDVGNAGIEQNIKRSEGYLAQAAHLREIAQQERDAQAMHWVEIAKERERLKLPPLGVPDGTLLQ